MFTQLLLPLATAFLFFFLWLVLRRREAHAQARDDFTRFITVINDWTAKRGDYQLTGRAISALNAHNDLITLAEHTGEPNWIASPNRKHYLAEYRRCQARHLALLTASVEDDSAHAHANELERAIQELNSQVDRFNG